MDGTESAQKVVEAASQGNWHVVAITVITLLIPVLLERALAWLKSKNLKRDHRELDEQHQNLNKTNAVLVGVFTKVLEQRLDTLDSPEMESALAYIRWHNEERATSPVDRLDEQRLDPIGYLQSKLRFTAEEAAEVARLKTDLQQKSRARRLKEGSVGADTIRDAFKDMNATDISNLLKPRNSDG